MKVYIATRLENIELQRRAADALREGGSTITYDWGEHGPVWTEGRERCREVAQAELRGVVEADLVFVLLPGGRGTHIELGAALALDKVAILYSEDGEHFIIGPDACAFYHHPRVLHIVGDEETLLCWCKELTESAGPVPK